jgi:hypothetical protein
MCSLNERKKERKKSSDKILNMQLVMTYKPLENYLFIYLFYLECKLIHAMLNDFFIFKKSWSKNIYLKKKLRIGATILDN